MKILLLGANGQLGRALQRSLAPLGDVVAPSRAEVNLIDPAALAAKVRAVRPAVIVNAAAHTAVDLAESEPDAAQAINALAPALLAREAQDIGAWLVHYSTDYVFSGSGSKPWAESDAAEPLNVYGRTKLEGDNAVQKNCARHLIFRTAWVHGDGGNFIDAILRAARQRRRLEVAGDQVGAPTSAAWLADVAVLALGRATGQENGAALAGLYHLTAAGETSRFDYACWLLAQARDRPGATGLMADELVPVETHQLKATAKRPLNSRLDCTRAIAAFGLQLPPWQAGASVTLDRLLGPVPTRDNQHG